MHTSPPPDAPRGSPVHPSDDTRAARATEPESESASPATLTAFVGLQRVAQGVAADVRAALRGAPVPDGALLRVFDDTTGALVALDLHAPPTDPGLEAKSAPVTAPPPAPPPARAVGRPRLGVVAREVTLLPRHWDWLSRQPGGASVALRRLVEEARRANAGRDGMRAAREATYRFMSEMAGDLPGFEEASRALFAGDEAGFHTRIAPWPTDLRTHLHVLSAAAWKEQ